jgi:glycosyltransferase involved in cell wall biosynthesis
MKSKKSQSNNNKPLISVVIPAYRAEKFIRKNLLEVKDVLDQVGYDYEIICVDDGNTDKTKENAKKVARMFPKKIKVAGYLTNLGKGHAVRFGMAKGKGKIIGFIDAGYELNPAGIRMLLEHFNWYNADIIVGSKRHPASKVIYPWQRRILSFGYQMIVRVLFGLKIKDTQVGMKFFKRNVLEKLLPRVLVKDFAFDIELLAVARDLGFNRIFEAPIEMKMGYAGSISTIANSGFIKTSFKTFWDTAAVFYRLKLLKYYDYKNRKNWITPHYLVLKNK